MYDAGKILTGLVIALVLLTFPLWYNMGTAAPAAPDPKLSAKALAAGECVYPKADMKTGHMQVLDDWRNWAIRDGHRWVVVSKDPHKAPEMKIIDGVRAAMYADALDIPGIGEVRRLAGFPTQPLAAPADAKRYEMSLQNTCMECHTSKKEFCDQCHDYMAVAPFCWDCHVAPKE